MSDPTILLDETTGAEVEPEYVEGAETCANCRYFEAYADVGEDAGWGTCDRPSHPGALFECSDGGTLDVEQGFYCSQHEPAEGEADEAYVTVPA